MASIRRLTAILAADVAGYSRLMGADEEGTHERLKAHLRELVEPKIVEHRGRTVKNTGDGLLAEFGSVVDAVRCAAEVQRAMADRNAETAEDKRITFRIGVNLGDVIVEEHDIFGDGVNVAARLEEHRCDEAIREYEIAIALNRNSANALFSLGLCKLLTGAIDETIPSEEQAIRLSPRDPYIFNRYLVIGEVHLLQSRTEEAIVWLERARAANPASVFPRTWPASAYALKGDVDHAINELAEAHRLDSSGGYYSINRMRGGYWGTPAIRALHEATFFAGLRKAGVPEK
jgi:hypothetical protein